MSNHW